jgi:hypothetical protein
MEMALRRGQISRFLRQFHRVKLLVQHRSLSIQLGKTIVVVEIKKIAIVDIVVVVETMRIALAVANVEIKSFAFVATKTKMIIIEMLIVISSIQQ